MKIKIPFIEVETNRNCPCEEQSEYELKLKCMKTRIHSIYIASIAFGLVVWALASGQANNEEFSSWISFASTVTSIILSVIAIFMSISGENKTDLMRDKMEEASKKIEKTAKDIAIANQESVKNITDLKVEMDDLKDILKNLPDATAKQVTQYQLVAQEEETAPATVKNHEGWLEP